MARNPVGRRGTPLERFERKIDKTDGCWIWTASKSPRGYGYFNCGAGYTKIVLAHRYSYLIYKGQDAQELYVCHSCDNPSCVNPDHLFLGTQTDNMRDCMRKDRKAGKLTQQQKREIIDDPRKLLEIANDYGVCFQRISVIKRGKLL